MSEENKNRFEEENEKIKKEIDLLNAYNSPMRQTSGYAFYLIMLFATSVFVSTLPISIVSQVLLLIPSAIVEYKFSHVLEDKLRHKKEVEKIVGKKNPSTRLVSEVRYNKMLEINFNNNLNMMFSIVDIIENSKKKKKNKEKVNNKNINTSKNINMNTNNYNITFDNKIKPKKHKTYVKTYKR